MFTIREKRKKWIEYFHIIDSSKHVDKIKVLDDDIDVFRVVQNIAVQWKMCQKTRHFLSAFLCHYYLIYLFIFVSCITNTFTLKYFSNIFTQSSIFMLNHCYGYTVHCNTKSELNKSWIKHIYNALMLHGTFTHIPQC